MKAKESGNEKVKKICDILRKETLEPATAEAHAIIEKAKADADRIINEAKESAAQLKKDALREIDAQKAIFQSSLSQASKQAIQTLKQQIENKLFNEELGSLLKQTLNQPKVLAEMINGLVRTLEKEGIDANLSAYISSHVAAADVNALLLQEVLKKLKEKSVLLSHIGGGVTLKLHDHHIKLDMSDAALQELLAQFVRKDFRDKIFQAT